MTCKDCIHYDVCVESGRTILEFYGENDAINFCSYFKDVSKFIEVPCSVGDVVYAALEDWNYPQTFEVMGGPVIPVYHYLVDTFIKISDFGKIVFPTYEEAKKKLEELKK